MTNNPTGPKPSDMSDLFAKLTEAQAKRDPKKGSYDYSSIQPAVDFLAANPIPNATPKLFLTDDGIKVVYNRRKV